MVRTWSPGDVRENVACGRLTAYSTLYALASWFCEVSASNEAILACLK